MIIEARAKLCVFIVCICIAFAVSSEATTDPSKDIDAEKDRSAYESTTHTTDESGHEETNNKCYLTCPDDYGKCKHKESWKCDLEAAIEIINNAKINFPTGSGSNDRPPEILDCSDLLLEGHRSSGTYTIWPISGLTENRPIRVYCDMETDGGGWTVIQRRGDFGNSMDYFYKDWNSYKIGFGNLEGELWLGNDNIFSLTSQRLYSARFDLMDVDGRRSYAHYGTFWIDGENNQYTLHIANYSGDAGDSKTEATSPSKYLNNQKFSTKDRDNDNWHQNCALLLKGAWWYNDCSASNLNGVNEKGKAGTIRWRSWKDLESLAWTEIKVRPRRFRQTEKS